MRTVPRNLIVFQKKAFSPDFRQTLDQYHWQIHVAHDYDQAIEYLGKNHFSTGLCVIDQRDDYDFLEQLKRIFDHTPQIIWVMALPKGCIENCSSFPSELQLIAQYCHDYLILPTSCERLLFCLGHANGMAEIRFSPFRDFNEFPSYEGIIGDSKVMRKLFKQMDKMCREDCSVLIQGETGTGKELIANAIHKHSKRAGNPMMALNCGAFPVELIQSELFGHEKGAFTGAQQKKIGRIESAQGGTLFLDEVGDLPLSQQVNLLRFLEERSIERIGSNVKIPIDVRVISATHVDLKNALQSGMFREDLYYRLKVLQLNVPPLRDREDDIELLAWYFFKKFSDNVKRKTRGFSTEAMNVLKHHHWPGNIREMMNCIRHAVIMSENRLITPADLGLDRRYKQRMKTIKTLEQARSEAERESIMTSIRAARYNMSLAAKQLGISRITLYRLIDKYKLEC